MNDKIKTTKMNNTSTQQEIQLAIYNKLNNMSQEQLLALNLIVDQIKQSNITTNDILNKISNALSGVKVIEKEKIKVVEHTKVEKWTDSELMDKIKELENEKKWLDDYCWNITQKLNNGCCKNCRYKPI